MPKIIWAQEPIGKKELKAGKSVFLAGPTPRTQEIKSWRPDMIKALNKLDTISEIFVPEPKNGIWQTEYDHQVEWEYEAIKAADILVFWIPRNVAGAMPGFTTNVEFGFWLKQKEQIILGYPTTAEKCKYLGWLYKKEYGQNPVHTLDEVVHLVKQIL